ncbi:hypothetical protein HD806DRAFT_538044 [Xylariaceae sp. AK1471]|nr:hypothetical protein HD806DRAFT_538044 [Xylariaceae sp. AK1471]
MAQQGGTYPASLQTEIIGTRSSPPQRSSSESCREGNHDEKSLTEKSREDTPLLEGTGVITQPGSSPQARDQAVEKKDSKDWVIVTNPEEQSAVEDEDNSRRRRWSSDFNLTLGWGRWKFTLLEWELHFEKLG